MSDEKIVEYLRSRGRVTPPLDLAGSVAEAIADTPQQRHSWFAPMIPGLAAVGIAAAVLVAALVIGQTPVGGPEPSEAADPTESAAPSVTEGPSVTENVLLTPEDSVTIDAVDAEGLWGEIIVTRGADTGGYPHAAVSPDSFIIEIVVAYDAARMPAGEFGVQDWALATSDDRRPVGAIFTPPASDDPSVPIEAQSMGSYPGAIDIFTTATGGWLFFEVPRSAADEELELIYRPEGFAEAVATFTVRQQGEAPAAVPSATPAPTPSPLSYVDQDGLPFTVIVSAEADGLFSTPDTCTNPAAGYSVTFPDDWYTNTQIGDVPACSWFSPTFYEVDDLSVTPEEIAITIGYLEGNIGFVHQPVYTVNDAVEVDGWATLRTEELGGFGADGYLPRSLHTYQYMVRASEDELGGGLKVFGTTSNEMGGSYDLNKAVLDRIMASLTLEDR